jgi:hypothetical protein
VKQLGLISEELGYWVGVAQSDGCLKRYFNKRRNYTDVRISLHVATKSLPMVKKFQEISSKLFDRHGKIWKENKGKNWRFQDEWEHHIAVKKLLKTFKELDIIFGDPPKPPKWCLENIQIFGSYLAGLLDGDGSIWLTKSKHKKSVECRVKITSSDAQEELKNAISKMLNCCVRLIPRLYEGFIDGRKISGGGYDLEFLISSKNLKVIKEFVFPHITIEHKKKKIQSFIDKRWPE